MLATSSSDDEDYDRKKTQPQAIKSSFVPNPRPGSYTQPNTPNVNAYRDPKIGVNPVLNGVSNMNINGDTNSLKSSISASSETDGFNRQNYRQRSSVRNCSFKSNSSAGTVGGATLTPGSLNTPRSSPRRRNGPGRQLPRRPGENASFSSSLNDRNLEDESDDNSEYNYEAHYANQTNMMVHQSSDEAETPYDDTEQNTEVDNQSPNEDNDSAIFNTMNRKQKQKENLEEEKNKAAAAALVAQQNEALKEAELHKKRLQIYVFVCRCIAYPFIAKQPTDMVRRQMKITKQQLQTLKDNFELFLQNKMTSLEADEAFTNAVRSYYEVFLKSDRVTKMVNTGSCSASDFRDVFKNNIEKRVRSLPEIDGLSKETVLSSWMSKFDVIFKYNEENTVTNTIASRRHSRNLNQSSNSMSSECILTKEQLYDLFQNILGIKKFEHQLIFNAAQLDNADEQAATIRRELDSRMKQTENIQKVS